MASQDILTQLFDKKILDILRVFFDGYDQQFYLREVARATRVPVASTFRIIQKLVDLKVIEQMPIKKFKLYKLADNENTRFIGQFIKTEKQALQVFVTRAKNVFGLETILLHGKEEPEGANIIIIGEEIDDAEIKKLCGGIKEQFGYKITALVLGREQFKQMTKMGLYPGRKRILFKAADKK